MSGQDFSLRPFLPIDPPLTIQLTGHIARRSHQLAIRYDLRGDLAELVIPAPAARPARRHGLWEDTCCEFFLGVKGAPAGSGLYVVGNDANTAYLRLGLSPDTRNLAAAIDRVTISQP